MTLHTNNVLGDLNVSKLENKTKLDYSPKNEQGREGKKYKGGLINLSNKNTDGSMPYA